MACLLKKVIHRSPVTLGGMRIESMDDPKKTDNVRLSNIAGISPKGDAPIRQALATGFV
jgi:hypothetical protein